MQIAWAPRGRIVVVAVLPILLAVGCTTRTPVLTGLIDAHDAAGNLQVHFAKAVDASNRAVMADTDEVSRAAAQEAEHATDAAQRDVAKLRPLLKDLQFADELRALESFDTRFSEYRQIERDILPLAVENTNLKAQRLLFGACADAVTDVRKTVSALARTQRAMSADRRDALVAQTAAAALEVQVVLARHIAEADDAAMTRMEQQMHASEAAADTCVSSLGRGTSPEALAAAQSSLSRFKAIVDQITQLSRRNTNVRSLALALGRQRTITSQCDEHLRELTAALAQHTLTATR